MSFKCLTTAFFPVLTGAYWYATCYVVIMLLSAFINKFFCNLSEKEYKIFLLIITLLFYIAPTFLRVGFASNSGKRLINMLVVYFWGRALALYPQWFRKTNWGIITALCSVICITVNILATYLNGGIGITSPLAKDNSVFILFFAIGLFEIVRKRFFYNKIVNFISGTTFSMYLFEGIIQLGIISLIEPSQMVNKIWLPLFVAVCVVLNMTLCAIIEIVRRKIMWKAEQCIANKLVEYSKRMENKDSH